MLIKITCIDIDLSDKISKKETVTHTVKQYFLLLTNVILVRLYLLNLKKYSRNTNFRKLCSMKAVPKF